MLTVAELVALAGAAVAAIGTLTNWRKSRPETEARATDALSRLLGDFNTLRDKLEASEDSEEDCQSKLAKMRAELAECMTRLARINERRESNESGRPYLALSEKVMRVSLSTQRVLNACRDGIVISDRRENGKFRFVNAAFARQLGRTPDEILRIGWQALIHPEDAEAALEVEGDAWADGGETKNRYRHADGTYVTLLWHFSNYEGGAALSVVWFGKTRTTLAPWDEESYDN